MQTRSLPDMATAALFLLIRLTVPQLSSHWEQMSQPISSSAGRKTALRHRHLTWNLLFMPAMSLAPGRSACRLPMERIFVCKTPSIK